MNNYLLITELILQLTQQTLSYATVMRKAQSEGRDVSDEELKEASVRYEAVRAAHLEAIERAKQEGR